MSTMNQFDLGLAVLSAAAYQATRNPKNQVPSGAIAQQIPGLPPPDNATGFEAYAYKYGDKVVIAYAGTAGPSLAEADQRADWEANAALGFGFPADQLKEAAAFYEKVANMPGIDRSKIVFTGHSLGGGLAALMGVFFNKPAVTFDPAPFRLSATQANKAVLQKYLVDQKFPVDGDLAGFTNAEAPLRTANPSLYALVSQLTAGTGPTVSGAARAGIGSLAYPTQLRGQQAISAYAITGEALSNGSSLFGPYINDLRIQNASTPTFIPITKGDPTALHSMQLLVAAATDSHLADVSNQLPTLMADIADPNLYATEDLKTSKPDFITKLVSQEYPSTGSISSTGGTGYVSKFVDDLTAVANATGDALTSTAFQNALIAAAEEMPYFSTGTSPKSLFTNDNGSIAFKYSDISASSGLKSRSMLSQAVSALLSPSEAVNARRLIGTANEWHLAGAGQLTVTSGNTSSVALGSSVIDNLTGGSNSDLLIGQGGADVLVGGGGADVLIGGADADLLEGDGGNDVLMGGAGNDEYDIADDGSFDRIIDSDGKGTLKYFGTALPDGFLLKDPNDPSLSNVWETGDGRFRYRLLANSDGTQSLQVKFNGPGMGSGSVLIDNYHSGDFNFSLLSQTISPNFTVTSGTGDSDNSHLSDPQQPSLASSDPNSELFGLGGADYIKVGGDGSVAYGGEGNDYIINGPGSQDLHGDNGDDILLASAGDDTLIGGSGRDALQGGAGNDLLDGGADGDFLDGGLGADIIYGGDGNDFILGGGNLTPALTSAAKFDAFAQGTLTWISGDAVNGFTLPDLTGADQNTGQLGATPFPVLEGDDGNIIDAGAGNDFVYGADGDDTISGGDGNDTLIGLAGNDYIQGGAGNDFLRGDATHGDEFITGWLGFYTYPQFHGNDYIDGGEGNDDITGDGGSDVLYGGAGDDRIDGDNQFLDPQYHGDDYIDGGDGNDVLIGDGGNDTILGGLGDDTIYGDSNDSSKTQIVGNDYIDAGDGNNYVEGGGGNDTILAGAGDDNIHGGTGDDYINAGDGQNQIEGNDGNDEIHGGANADQIYGGSSSDPDASDGNDYIDGAAGDDYLRGGAGNDQILGGDGNDTIGGDAGSDQLQGGSGNDQLFGGAGDDSITGDAGDDYLSGDDGNDTLLGGDGNDQLSGGNGDDYLDGGAGTNQLNGGAGNDILVGGAGDNGMDGGDGNDTLIAGSGLNNMQGGAGDDTYQAAGAAGVSITDAVGKNTLVLSSTLDQYHVAQDANDKKSLIIQAADGTQTEILYGLINSTFSYAATDQTVTQAGLLDGMSSSTIVGDSDNNTIDGTGGDDLLGGGYGDDVLRGGRGVDVLVGGEGNDTLDGGTGTNTLIGDNGDDTYVINQNGSSNEIIDADGKNTIRFGAGITADAITLSISGTDLTFDVGLGTTVKVDDGLLGVISNYQFADGTSMTHDDLMAKLLGTTDNIIVGDDADNTLGGGDGNDQILGQGGNDRLGGGGGDDHLVGGWGDDILTGGKGNDLLEGGDGNDTYVFNKGDGQDVISDNSGKTNIQFGSDVALADVTAQSQPGANGNDLVLTYGTGDQVTVTGGIDNPVSSYALSDGSTLTQKQLFLTAMHSQVVNLGTTQDDTIYGQADADNLAGNEGNDIIFGGDGNDTIDGGNGSDTIVGGGGDDNLVGSADFDTYVAGANTGMDTVTGESDTNRILLDPTTTLASVVASRVANDVVVHTDGNASGSNGILLKDYGSGNQSWLLQDAYGATTGLSALLLDSNAATSTDDLKKAFLEQLRAQAGGGRFPDGTPMNEGDHVITDSNGDPHHYIFTVDEASQSSDDSFIPTSGGESESDTSTFTYTEQKTTTTTFTDYEDNSVQGPDQIRILPIGSGGANALNGTRVLGDANTTADENGDGYIVLTTKGKTVHQLTPVNHTVTTTEAIDHFRYDSVANTVIDDVTAGDSSNVIEAGIDNAINAGDGNDFIYGSDPGNVEPDAGTTKLGMFVDGGAGDDSIIGSARNDEIIGNTGSDTMDGRGGSDTYRELAGEDGHDVIDDTAVTPQGTFSVNFNIGNEVFGVNYSQDGDLPLSEENARAIAALPWQESSDGFSPATGYTPGTLSMRRTPYTTDQFGNQITTFDQMAAAANQLDALAPGFGARFAQGVSDAIAASGGIGVYGGVTLNLTGFDGLFDANGVTAQAQAVLAGHSSQTLMDLVVPQDTVAFDHGINKADLAVSHVDAGDGSHNALNISWGGPGSVTVVQANQDDGTGYGIEKYTFSDGTTLTADQMAALATDDHAPVFNGPIANQSVPGNAPFLFTIPDGVFTDVDANDQLNFTATQANGDSLPSWLSFDAATQTFSGTPAATDQGHLVVNVKATDLVGESTIGSFGLDVTAPDRPPVAVGDVLDVTQDTSDNLIPQLLANDSDPDQDPIAVTSVDTTNTSGTVAFDRDNQTLTYTANSSVGVGQTAVDHFSYTVSDPAGATSTADVSVNITGVDHAPYTFFGIDEQQAQKGTPYSLTLPQDFFTDPDPGDTLTYSAINLDNGNSLPSWLSFDPSTLTFSGTPGKADVGGVDVLLTATDSYGASASDAFRIDVADVNEAPIVATHIADQSAQATYAFSFKVPDGSFTDPDVGDSLTYKATLSNNKPLPSWLTFDPNTQTFSGMPANLNVGAVTVKVTATDTSGATVSDNFKISIAASSGTITGSAVADNLVGSDGNDIIDGKGGADTIAAGGGNDTVTGGAAGDTLDGGSGNDVVRGGGGNDTITGGTGNDLVAGDGGNDTLDGGQGNDVVQGGTGADHLTDAFGNNLLDAGAGADVINATGANNVVIGGKGADTVNVGSGNDLLAFNAGDGTDVVHSTGGGTDTISLGGAMDRANFQLQKSGNDLKLYTGSGDSLTFQDWYSDQATHSFLNLQIINDATANYNPNSTDPTLNKKVEDFNFNSIVNAFDAARAANTHVNRWNLMNSLLSAYLGGSDDSALGGDFAYRYGVDGTLAGMGFDPAEALLANSQLTTNPTALSAVASLQTGDQRLS